MHRLSFRISVTAAILACAAFSSAVAQDSAQPRPETLDALMACRTQSDPMQRLTCFDAAAASLDQAERQGEVIVVDRQQVTEARRQLFGFDLPSMPTLFDRGQRAPALNAIETTLTRATSVGNGMWVFALGDGSVWRQVNMEATRFSERPGQPCPRETRGHRQLSDDHRQRSGRAGAPGQRMTEPRPLTPDIRVSGQISTEDVQRAAVEGVTLIINNRPDGEEPGQPTSAQIEAAAQAAGIAYIHAPAIGMPGPDTVAVVGQALAQGGQTWMFCRSGMRSTAAWALAMSQSGALEPEAIRDIAARAGYDLSRLPL